MNIWSSLRESFTLTNIIYTSIHVIYIALIFEAIAWWLGSRIERLTSPLITADADREHPWRIRRRALLRKTPKAIARTLCYVIAGILIFDIFGVPVLPLSIGVGAVVALFGSAVLPQMRDMAQGYVLLGEDAIAVGDLVEVNGVQGQVEKFTLRGLRLKDHAGRGHHLSNRDVTHVIVIQRRVGETQDNSMQKG